MNNNIKLPVVKFESTNETLEKQKEILVKDINGIKIAFLSFTYGTNGISIPKDKSFAVK